jgi:DNA-binding XRE family transcriptional regulator
VALPRPGLPDATETPTLDGERNDRRRHHIKGVRMSKKISGNEAKRRRAQSARDRQRRDRDRLLYTRQEVAKLYGISIASIIRMEADGRLRGLKLGPSKNNRTLYRAADVERLAFAGVENVG